MTFLSLGLSNILLRAISDQGYAAPTPIQVQAIPALLRGRDLLATAQTGTGKTAAYMLPVLQRLGQDRSGPPPGSRVPRALVLVPTRELAMQVSDSARPWCRQAGIRTAVVFGGVSVQAQASALRQGVDLLVATPGRLLDLMARGHARLSGIEVLVLDEADRMLDMGFIHDLKRILGALPKQRQTALFSATFSEEMRRFAAGFLNQPLGIEVAPRNATAERVMQSVCHVPESDKWAVLAHLLREESRGQTLVFTRTKQGANRLAEQLDRDGFRAAAIHGNKSQSARNKALADFKADQVQILVATDIAARGLDIQLLSHVINYELPHTPEDYVHRIGRTGRAGAEGSAISLVSTHEGRQLRAIERLLDRRLPAHAVPGALLSASKGERAESRSPVRQASLGLRGDASSATRSPSRGQGIPARGGRR